MASDWAARTIGIASMIVTGAVGYFNYSQSRITFEEQKRQFEVLQSEHVLVSLDAHAKGPFLITSINFGANSHVAQFPWELQLTNSGNQKLSIVKYNISSGTSPMDTFYTGIDGGLVTIGNQPVKLPITLETGESRSFFLMVGIRVPTYVFDVLSAIDPKKRTTENATIALGKKGLDLYGNKVEFSEYGGGSYSLTVLPEDQRSPTFWCQIVTGRGNEFTTSTSTYARAK
jgi:hypothetical protein